MAYPIFPSILFKIQALLKLLLVFVLFLNSISAQTVGLINAHIDATPGFTLFAPNSVDSVYLIDKCGHRAHTWFKQGLNFSGGVYLLEDGSLLHGAKYQGTDYIQRLDWDGTLLWRYTNTAPRYIFHHDLLRLPNGNVIVLAYDRKDSTTCLNAGRDPSLLASNRVFSEALLELQPIGQDSAVIVWKWHLWDHVVQDFDPGKANYGVVADHPERMNLNFVNPMASLPGGQDWIHANGLAYNPEFDQLMFSSRHSGEFYLIDHSTTTAEASTSTGGRWGKGGDFLFRWGNPMVYDRGDSADIQLWGPHNPTFLPENNPFPFGIMVFNNGWNRPGSDYSEVFIIEPLLAIDSSYALLPDSTFGQSGPSWVYNAPVQTSFFSEFISGAQRLGNGHTLICSGAQARIFEIDNVGNEVWRYINPVSADSVYNQGDVVPFNGFGILPTVMFRATLYEPGYPGLAGRDLSPKGRLEGNPLSDTCLLTGLTDDFWIEEEGSGIFFPEREGIIVYPNPSKNGHLTIRGRGSSAIGLIRVFDSVGRKIWEESIPENLVQIDLGERPPGVYYFQEEREGAVTKVIVGL